MSAIQEEEIKAGTALTPCKSNVVLYGLRSGWNRDKLKFDPQQIPVNLPVRAKQEILREYALYSVCYDLGEGAHRFWRVPYVKRLTQVLVAAAVLALFAKLGVDASLLPSV